MVNLNNLPYFYVTTTLTNIHFLLINDHSYRDSAMSQMGCGEDGGGEKAKTDIRHRLEIHFKEITTE